MTEPFYIPLSDRAVLRLSGKDSVKFLQGLLTRDMNRLAPGTALYALMLTPQGKFLYDFFLVQEGEALLLDVDTTQKPEIIRKLGMYKLRSDVTIEETDYRVVASQREWPGMFADPRIPALGWRGFLTGEVAARGTRETYEQLRIRACVPDTRTDMVSGKVFPLFFRMDELNAIDFDKGCYVGQEVTTRSKHRGNLHKSIFTVEGSAKLPAPGTAVMADGKSVGELLSSVGSTGLALLEKADTEKKLMAGETELRVVAR